MAKAAASTTTKKKANKQEKKAANPEKKIGKAKIDESNIVTGTRRRKQVDYSDAKTSRVGGSVSRDKPLSSSNTLEKRASAKIEKPKKTRKTGATKGSKKATTTKKEDKKE